MSRIDDIRAREQAATKGPCEALIDPVDPTGSLGRYVIAVQNDHSCFIATRHSHDLLSQAIPDVQFLAHCFEDIPYLLTEITRLSGLVERAEVIMEDNEHLDKRITGWLESARGEDTP